MAETQLRGRALRMYAINYVRGGGYVIAVCYRLTDAVVGKVTPATVRKLLNEYRTATKARADMAGYKDIPITTWQKMSMREIEQVRKERVDMYEAWVTKKYAKKQKVKSDGQGTKDKGT